MINTHTYMYTQINTHRVYCVFWQERKYYILLIYSRHVCPFLGQHLWQLCNCCPFTQPCFCPLLTFQLKIVELLSAGLCRLGSGLVTHQHYGFFRQWPVRHAGGGQTDPTSKWSGNSNLEYVMQRKPAFWLESEKPWLESQASHAACAILSKYTITQSLRCW